MKTLIDIDSAGNKLYHEWDEETKTGTLTTEGDAQPLLDLNQAARNNESGNWKGDMHHVASIDPVTYMNIWKMFGGNPMAPENQPRLMKLLNDRDWSKLRVKSGRL